MPIHYRHALVPGGPLRGAAFPRILPEADARERAARRSPESQSPVKLLGSLWNNVASAARLRLGSVDTTRLRQTWRAPASAGTEETFAASSERP
jgi:hypothetical protein